MFEHVLRKIEMLKSAQIENVSISSEKRHVAFGIDEKFAMPMGVLMTSLILNNLDEQIVFHVITDGLNKKDINRLKQLNERYNVVIYIYYIDAESFQKMQTTENWTIAIYYRLVIASILPKTIKKILYLDSDIICVGSLKDFFDINFAGMTVVAVKDVLNLESNVRRLSLKSNCYFNSGMLFIDIEAWRRKSISERAIQMLQEDGKRYTSPDQDVLNVLLDCDVQYVNKSYNYLYTAKSDIMKNIKLIHYAAAPKPWDIWCTHSLMAYFLIYHKKSVWCDVEFNQPRNYKEMRRMGRACIHKKKYLESIFWFYKYAVYKMKEKIGRVKFE